MHRSQLFLLGLALCGLLASCATPLSEAKMKGVSTIGIVNSFPLHPNMAFTGTTVFTNRNAVVPDTTYHSHLTKETARFLRGKGYQVVEKSGLTDLHGGKVQMLIELVPRQAYEAIRTRGYGIYQRSFMGVSQGPQSYVAMNIRPITQESELGFHVFYLENYEPLSIDELPRSWENVTSAQRKEMDLSLRSNISETTHKLMGKLGLPSRK